MCGRWTSVRGSARHRKHGFTEGSLNRTVCARRAEGWRAEAPRSGSGAHSLAQDASGRRPKQARAEQVVWRRPGRKGPAWVSWVCVKATQSLAVFRWPGRSVRKRHRSARTTQEWPSEDLGRFWKRQSNFSESEEENGRDFRRHRMGAFSALVTL